MLICDTHADTLYKMQCRVQNPELTLDVTPQCFQRAGDVCVQAFALFTGLEGLAADPELVERELEMFRLLQAEGFHQITKIEEALPGVPNALLTVEGGEVFLGGVETVDRFFALGVRIAGLVWNNPSGLAYPAIGGDDIGLTAYGRQVVKRLHSLGIAVDISHINAQGVLDLLEMGGPPPMASHSCAHALCAHPRNLTDSQLRNLFGAGGYVGVNFYPPFLHESGYADINTVVDHIAHMCDLGGEAHVGLGSDFDGIDKYPRGLWKAGDVPRLLERMGKRGFGEALIAAIAGENLKAYMDRLG